MTTQQPLFAQSWRWKGREGTATARFSEDRKYRYELRRTWKHGLRPLVAILLNPSKGNELHEDPTIRRLLTFADSWGFGGLILTNIFALCSTDPRALKTAVKNGDDPIGPENDAIIRGILRDHAEDKLLIGWGTHGHLLQRGRNVASLAVASHRQPECFGLTKNGQPFHPLFLPDVSVPHAFTQLVRQRAEASR